MEVELKLALQRDGLEEIKEKVIPKLNGQSTYSSQAIANEYFDTPELLLHARKMGFRIRTQDGICEQTIKTEGLVQGGLHQRPEYNVGLDKPVPDLTKFDRDIFAENFDLEYINRHLVMVFTTHFHRHQWHVEFDDGVVEFVYDQGEIKSNQDVIEINEIELELKSGKPSILHEIADVIAEHLAVRLSNISKAVSGYRLVKDAPFKTKSLPMFLPLENNLTTEQGLISAINCGFDHWLYHQDAYLQCHDSRALYQIRESLLLLLYSVALYLPVLQSEELLALHKQLLKLTQRWHWTEQLMIIRRLRSKKGAFCKRVPKESGIMNYLLGRREGLLQAQLPDSLISQKDAIKVQLSLSRIVQEKPWRVQNSGADILVRKHANGWLSQTWQSVVQSLPSSRAMDANQYLGIEVLLHQSLMHGFLLGDLFTETRGSFRAPWLDLLDGIHELKALHLLQAEQQEFEIDEPNQFKEWLNEKQDMLLKVMEMSREAAMRADTYW
ncbi:MAG: CYTH domain-containing protein [Pseudomonadota bacterium]